MAVRVLALATLSVLLAGAGVAVVFGLLLAADPILAVRAPVRKADVIVVLGGDGPRRAARAAKLYREGYAPRVLVSGGGDCLYIRDAIVERGVPPGAVTTECDSRTTWENAELSERIIRRMDVSDAILVTSWFHTRRALACFRANMPGIRWMPVAVERDQPLTEIATDIEGRQILKEYLKIGWYTLRYGIQPIAALGVPAPVRDIAVSRVAGIETHDRPGVAA